MCVIFSLPLYYVIVRTKNTCDVANLKFSNTLSGTTQYSLNITTDVCIDMIKLLSKCQSSMNSTQHDEKMCIGVVGDVVVYCQKKTGSDFEICATTNSRHPLCTLKVFDHAMLFQQHEPFVITKGLHKLGLGLQSLMFTFDDKKVTLNDVKNTCSVDGALTAMRSYNLYVLNSNDHKLNVLSHFNTTQNRFSSKQKNDNTESATHNKSSKSLHSVALTHSGDRLTISNESLFQQFFKLNAHLIAKVMQSLPPHNVMLHEARAQCVNAALLAVSDNISCDTWAPTMQEVCYDTKLHSNLQKSKTRLVGMLQVPCSHGVKQFPVIRSMEINDIETCHTGNILAVCVNNRYVFLGDWSSQNTSHNKYNLQMPSLQTLNMSNAMSMDSDENQQNLNYNKYMKQICLLATCADQHKFIRTQKANILSQISADVTKNSHLMTCHQNAVLRVMLNSESCLVHAFRSLY